VVGGRFAAIRGNLRSFALKIRGLEKRWSFRRLALYFETSGKSRLFSFSCQKKTETRMIANGR
jgi:hypothetical protein